MEDKPEYKHFSLKTANPDVPRRKPGTKKLSRCETGTGGAGGTKKYRNPNDEIP
ncbi:MAG: hypothetical protein GY869_10485 [Planctomycetes bacterium]|nr:hypothetical protein [Planctomycetota bacterium]